jgi:hypothetical protein
MNLVIAYLFICVSVLQNSRQRAIQPIISVLSATMTRVQASPDTDTDADLDSDPATLAGRARSAVWV